MHGICIWGCTKVQVIYGQLVLINSNQTIGTGYNKQARVDYWDSFFL